MDEINIVELSKKQVREIYKKNMCVDFPEDELKPLSMLIKSINKGIYECLGMMKDGDLLGYAFFVKNNKDCLLDYFAIVKEHRNSGLGATFLKYIAEYYKDTDSVILEVENPAFAINEEDRILQKRRYNFYLRNGYIDTGVWAKLFGVNYIILELDLGKAHSKEQIEELYLSNYKIVLPKRLFKKKISISN